MLQSINPIHEFHLIPLISFIWMKVFNQLNSIGELNSEFMRLIGLICAFFLSLVYLLTNAACGSHSFFPDSIGHSIFTQIEFSFIPSFIHRLRLDSDWTSLLIQFILFQFAFSFSRIGCFVCRISSISRMFWRNELKLRNQQTANNQKQPIPLNFRLIRHLLLWFSCSSHSINSSNSNN